MGLKCLFGHKWSGCKCERCGKIRDEEHKWNNKGTGCKCHICGKTRNEGHKWVLLEGKCTEKCSVCGKEQIIDHKWNDCKCERCGKISHNFVWLRNESESRGNWDYLHKIYKCTKCGIERTETEERYENRS